MTPPTFNHAGWCSIHGDWDKPIGEGRLECTCGADARREQYRAVVVELALDCIKSDEPIDPPVGMTDAEQAAFDFGVDAALEFVRDAIRKLKVPDGE